MTDGVKRRSFLSCVAAALAAGPFALFYFGKRKSLSSNDFDKEFKKYASLIDVPVRSATGPRQFSLKLTPPAGDNLKYVIFIPAVMKGPFSRAVGGEPDGFYVREGRFAVHQTERTQTVIYGGDEIAKVCYPTSTEVRGKSKITLLEQNGELRQAVAKGERFSSPRETLMFDLLTLRQLPPKDLSIGTKWTASTGRIKPFKGVKTSYEVVGFSEIAGCKAANIKFEGSIAGSTALPGVRADISKNETMKNTHSGNAWFDLETGLLVRQETRMTTEVKGAAGLEKPLTVAGDFTVQLFHV